MKKNVVEFTTVRNHENTSSEGKALIRVDELGKAKALRLHTKLKEEGRGAIKTFVEEGTPYANYSAYKYQLKKLGVMPLHTSGVVKVSETEHLHQEIQKLQRQLAVAKVSPAKRALGVLFNQWDSLGSRSRVFLCTIIAQDRSTITEKQDKWLADLEARIV
jgi:hypothetical protein